MPFTEEDKRNIPLQFCVKKNPVSVLINFHSSVQFSILYSPGLKIYEN